MPVPSEADPTRVLTLRLDALRGEHAALLTETRSESKGDVADQATNVELLIRLQLLEERIASIELELAEGARREHVDGVVSVGDVVTLDLGDGDETYLIGSVEQAYAGIDTITPGSPIGRAIVGAEVGSQVTYEPRRGVRIDVTIKSAGEPLPASA
jgi:transcription elongation factor GreA